MLAAYPDQLPIAPSYEGAWREYLAHLGTVRADDARYAPGGEGRLVFLVATTPAPAETGTGLAPASAPVAAVATALALALALGALARRRRRGG